MNNGASIGTASPLSTVLCVLVIGLTLTEAIAEDKTEILKIKVGEPTMLSNQC